MKLAISAVITTYNSVDTIEKTLSSVYPLVSEIILVDNGSTDGTLQVGEKYDAVIVHEKWHGYGQNKNIGIQRASYPWIFSLDADESISPALESYVKNINLTDISKIYKIKSKNYLGDQWIKYGSWGHTFNFRLFHRDLALWDHSPVHEDLVFDNSICTVVKVKAPIIHHTSKNLAHYNKKLNKYAHETALKYLQNKKAVGVYTPYLSSAFLFVKEYILLGGILDGKAGLGIAGARAKANFLKYKLILRQAAGSKINS